LSFEKFKGEMLKEIVEITKKVYDSKELYH